MEITHLSAAEMGKLWITYVGNTMGKCVLSHYLKHVDDTDIKMVLEYALSLTESRIQNIESIFNQAEFPIPIGFTDDDVDLKAPRLFYDEFYLHYLEYLGKAGMSIYSVAIPLMTRKDVRDFFIDLVQSTAKLMKIIAETLQSKNALTNAPIIPPPNKVDFVTNQSFLNVLWGDVRPLHGLEVAHLYGNITDNNISKALIIGFSQGARSKKIRNFLERGKDINQKHIEMVSDKLSKDNLPSPSLLDHLVTSSTTPPFSDKLMIYHKVDMFSMKIRTNANGASFNGRKDIGSLFAICQADVALYAEDGTNILIDHGWFEQPPEAVDREQLITK